jgi:hypothetical protein
LKDPIFIIGTGRSGTTILFNLLKEHPKIYWLSNLMNRYPEKILLNDIVMRLFNYQIFKRIIKKHIHPAEAYSFWDQAFSGFSMPCRDLLAEDVTPTIKTAFIKKVSKCSVKDRDQFLGKITGWPRIGFIQEIFSNAKFIHIMRDGRDVAYSLVNYPLWRGWYGPENWRWGSLPQKFSILWENHRKSFLVLAAIQWIILEEAFKSAIDNCKKGSVLSIKYENFCSDALDVIKCVVDFCDLKWTEKFEYNLKKYKIFSSNNKWEKYLKKSQQIMLQKILKEYLIKFGYEA